MTTHIEPQGALGDSPGAPPNRPPNTRDSQTVPRPVQHRVVNAVVSVAAIAFFGYLVAYLIRQDFRYDFASLPFATDISRGLFKIASSDFVWIAALKGVGNTIALVGIGIVISSIIGLLVGIARLSRNPLLAGLARLYVEVLRNVPLLVLMFMFAFVIFASLPNIATQAGIPGLIYFSNRGIAVPQLTTAGGLWWVWVLLAVAAIVGSTRLGRALRLRESVTGRKTYSRLIAFAAWLLFALVSFFALGRPIRVLGPVIDQSSLFPSYSQGAILSLGYVSALFAISLYFGGFIAEIVRGSIQAIPKQQTEAAEALGLSATQRFLLVILPQALQIMIPALNNEYQNANKDSSLAHLITYSEVVFVAIQVANNRGHFIELFIGVFLVFVLLNLLISSTMNLLNKAVRVVT